MNKSKDTKGKQNSEPYLDTLDGTCRARYREKIEIIGGKDPYEITAWNTDVKKLPGIEYPDIVNYLVCSRSAYTMEQMKAYKSLQAYNYFVSGFVMNMGNATVNDKCVVSGKVRHSQMMNAAFLNAWLICEIDGTIRSGHCTCMAGLGEVCSHVGALLFAIEAAVKMRNSRTVTEEKSYWLPSAVQKVQYKTVFSLSF